MSVFLHFIARCPVGTYYDRPADDCLLCPEGTYSPREGALACERCPEGTWTLGTRKENFTACTGTIIALVLNVGSCLGDGFMRGLEC